MLFPKQKRPTSPKKPMSPEAKKQFTIILVMSVILLVLYYGIMAAFPYESVTTSVMLAYMICFGVILVSYIAYNRGFVNKDVTVDMLPEDWSDEKKQAFVEGNRRRAEKSRWMLAIIIPFVVVFMVEALYLFVWDGWLSDFLKG